MSKRVIIVHGYTGYPDKNWFPWLKGELEKEGIEVLVPAMPHTEAPQLSEWLPYLREIVGDPDGETYLIGHSLGCVTILRYLEALPADKQLGGIVLVSGFSEPIHFTELNNFFDTPLDDRRIREAAGRIVTINSDNDEHVPLWQAEKLAERLGVKAIILSGAGHINAKSGFTEFPLALDELKKLIINK